MKWQQPLFAKAWYKGVGFVRVGQWILSTTNNPPLFSERNGYRKPFLRIGKRRFFLERSK